MLILIVSTLLVLFHIAQIAEMCSIYMTLLRKLKPGEHGLPWGKCYICGEMEAIERVDDKYLPLFVLDENEKQQFVGKTCYFSKLRRELKRVPVSHV